MSEVDLVWVVACSVLVLLMQVGFTCLEAGLVRSHSTVAVASKNALDFMLTALIFWLFGFGLMFGQADWVLSGAWRDVDDSAESARNAAIFLFQLTFAGTSVTIISGAVAERIRFVGYLLISLLVAALIYPVYGNWAWAGVYIGDEQGWLAAMGFYDFAGAGVVHAIGGWVALAAVLVLGPRTGRFGAHAHAFRSNNLPLAAIGVLVLWVGWMGFNGGAFFAFNEDTPLVLVKTLLAGAAGGVASLAVSLWRLGNLNILYPLNGSLAGLVAITASISGASTMETVLIGGIGGVICVAGMELLERLKIDDVIGVVPVHAFGGTWGLLACAIMVDPAHYGSTMSSWSQLGVQAIGALAAFVWAFGVSYIVLSLINRVFPLRVGFDVEQLGLDAGEHGIGVGGRRLVLEMQARAASDERVLEPVKVDPYSDAADIALMYNALLDKVNEARLDAEATNHAKDRFLSIMSHELRTPLNGILGGTQILSSSLDMEANPEAAKFIHMLDVSGKRLLKIVQEVSEYTEISSGALKLNLGELSVAVTVNNALKLIEKEADLAFVSVQNLVGDDVDVRLYGDEERLKQIILIYLTNAVVYQDAGGSVQVEGRQQDEFYYRIMVTDDGPGIETEQQKELFIPFQRLDQEAGKVSGTGTGLAIAKRLATLMGGRVGCESTAGVGSCFWVDMPVATGKHDSVPPTPGV